MATRTRMPVALEMASSICPLAPAKRPALDVAAFHLALEAHRDSERRAAVRIALVVDRTLGGG